MRKAAKLMKASEVLPISLLENKKNVDIWLMDNEPTNRLSNILADDHTSYRNKTPQIDLNLYNDALCFVSEVLVDPTEPRPGETELFVATEPNKWVKMDYGLAKEGQMIRYILKGETYCKYLRIFFLNNDRRGHYIGIRQIRIKGIKQSTIMI